MNVKVYGDGEIGTFSGIPDQTQYPCGQDPFGFDFSFTGDPITCTLTDYTVEYTGNIPANAVIIKDFDGATIVSGSDPGPYVIQWTTPGNKTVSITVIDPVTGLPAGTASFNVEVLPKPTTDFIISNNNPAFGCDTVTVVYTGNQPASSIFDWEFDFTNSGAVTVIGGPQDGPGPFKLVYNQPGLYVVTLESVDNGVCKNEKTDTTQTLINIQPKPGTKFVASKTELCMNDTLTVTFTDLDKSGTYYDWDFDGSFPYPSASGTGTGLGPFTVSWNSPGVKTIRLKVAYPGCPKEDSLKITVKPTATVSAGIDTLICYSTQPIRLAGNMLNGAGCGVTWTTLDGTVVSNQLAPFVNPSVTTSYILQANCQTCFSNRDTVTIKVRPFPIAAVPVSEIHTCLGTGGVTLPATANNGTGPLTYQWSPSTGLNSSTILNPIANPTANTTYTLVVTDSIGCQATPITIDVVIDPRPVADAGSNQVLCVGGSANITLDGQVVNPVAGQTYSYEWSPVTGLACPTCASTAVAPQTGVSAIIYTLKVKSNETGCQSVAQSDLARVTVFFRQAPTANPGVSPINVCRGETVTIGDVPSGGGPDYTYLWQPNGETTQFIDVTPPVSTTYTLVVSSNGCDSEPKTLTVNVLEAPQASISPSEISLCPGGSATLLAGDPAVPLPADIAYSWEPKTGLSDPNIKNPTASPSVTTTYSLTVFNSKCPSASVATATVTIVAPPVVEADPSGLNSYQHCQFDSTTKIPLAGAITPLDPSYTFQWKPGKSVLDSTSLTTFAMPSTTQYIYLEATSPEGCVTRDSIFVSVQPTLKAKVDPDTSKICNGDTVWVGFKAGRGAAQFSWSPTTGIECLNPRCSGVIATPSKTTNYKVTIQEGICDTVMDVRIEVYQQPTSDFFPVEREGCENIKVVFLNQSINEVGYQWDFGDGTTSNIENPTHEYTAPGLYDVTLTTFGAYGQCTSSVTKAGLINIKPLPEADFSSKPDLEETVGDSLILPEAYVQFKDETQDSAIAWHWDFGDSTYSVEQNPRHQYKDAGVFEVKLIVTNNYGCIDTVKQGHYYVAYPDLQPLPNVFTPDGDGMNDRFGPKYYGTQTYKLTIFDRWGVEYYSGSTAWDGKMKSSDAPNGVYFYEFTLGDRVWRGNVTLIRN